MANAVTRKFKFPRKYSRTYCKKTPCNKMGFTQRSSCRPYKNCFRARGGAKKTVRKSSKAKRTLRNNSGSQRASSKHVNHPRFYYHTEQVSFTSHPQKGEPYGKRTVVTIKNGEGTKRMELLNKIGKPKKVNEKPLKKEEVSEIAQGNYVPGLWIGV